MIRRIDSQGFTLTELIVVVSIMFVTASIALPELSSFRGQMQASQDIRKLASVLGELRTEAIRLKANVRVSFTEDGYSWDIMDDSTTDGTIQLGLNSSWEGADVPDDIIFNGLGLVRNLGAPQATITLRNRSSEMQLKVNTNGYIQL